MSKSVVRDLSSELPSGRHQFEGNFRIPLLGWRFKLAAQSPDRAPAAVATAVLAFVGGGLAWPGALALVADQTRLPSWTILAASAVFAVTMIGETRVALWYQRRRRLQDLTALEGDPTDRADVLIEEQQTHEMEIGTGQQTVAAVNWTSSPRSLPGLGVAFLILAAATLIPAAVFTGLATLIPATPAETMIAVMLAFITVATCGIVAMIRIEQLERGATPPATTETENEQTLAAPGRAGSPNGGPADLKATRTATAA